MLEAIRHLLLAKCWNGERINQEKVCLPSIPFYGCFELWWWLANGLWDSLSARNRELASVLNELTEAQASDASTYNSVFAHAAGLEFSTVSFTNTRCLFFSISHAGECHSGQHLGLLNIRVT